MSGSDGSFVVGIDFGTLSGRAVVVRVRDGAELAEAVHPYADAVLDTVLPDGTPLPADWALQNPADWVDVLRTAVPEAIRRSGVAPASIVGIGTDFTACTVLPTDAHGRPLCQREEFRSRPHAWPKLWKHHAAQPQADRINELAHRRGEPWIGRYGGRISSEWQFAKALQLLEEDPAVWDATERWIEAADWIVWQLTGVESRNACTAGYKGIFQDGTYPAPEFLAELHPGFADFPETRLGSDLLPLGSRAGGLTVAASAWTGLPPGLPVAVGNVDAHVSAPAARATESGRMLAVLGTSTCHVMNSSVLRDVPGMCGVVDGGIVAGSYGYEAGQSGVGDIFAWWIDNLVPEAYHDDARCRGQSVHQYLTDLTADQPVGAHGLIALDWMNGNRSVLVDHELSGIVVGLTIATRPEEVYRALLEATAFGTRRIIDAFADAGVPVSDLVVAGGLTKNASLMQTYADVTGLSISVAESSQTPALGSAIHAAVAAGEYRDVHAAAQRMGRCIDGAYVPDEQRHESYTELYVEYCLLHDYFGYPEKDGGNGVLHRLRNRRNAARLPAATASATAAGSIR